MTKTRPFEKTTSQRNEQQSREAAVFEKRSGGSLIRHCK
jgi:hypothetical protein